MTIVKKMVIKLLTWCGYIIYNKLIKLILFN